MPTRPRASAAPAARKPAKKAATKAAKKAPAKTASARKVTAHDHPLKGATLKGKAKVLSSKTVYKGKVFWVTHDDVAEPGGVRATRDVVRHNGSVVVLAVDHASNPADPGILLIRQYRHAASDFLLELPAGRIDAGEKLLAAAKRELIEETGYRAKKWSVHAKYFASPGFVSEAMHILLAEDLTLGEATPEDDEKIELHMTPLSEVVRMIQQDKIHDGKTIIGVLLYDSLRRSGTVK